MSGMDGVVYILEITASGEVTSTNGEPVPDNSPEDQQDEETVE